MKERFSQRYFNFRISETNGYLFNFNEYKSVLDVLSSRWFFERHPVVINADPFLFVKNGLLYVFYEEQVDLRGKGVIKMLCTANLQFWTEAKLVLEEPYHLSYPNVFRINGEIYMLPETGNNNTIQLYKPNATLDKWKLYKILLKGSCFVDSSIFYYNNYYYLFTSIFEHNEYKLMLYYSISLESTWFHHPSSPISIGKNSSRCGGAIFEHQGKIYRPAQICNIYYGEGLSIYEIEVLTTEKYKEKLIYNRILPFKDNFHNLGGHHFNKIEFKGKTIVATDALSSHYNFWEILHRIREKLSVTK